MKRLPNLKVYTNLARLPILLIWKKPMAGLREVDKGKGRLKKLLRKLILVLLTPLLGAGKRNLKD
uniref:Uncharacterized protein n=1 Tax=Rhizophora mucronata TaxID=61149 RepID=A0A2P2IX75_RHIMU